MKKVYIAKRIPKEPNIEFLLKIDKEMEPEDVFKLYVEKIKIGKKYIYNGPWVLRKPLSENIFTPNKMPKKLTPYDIWKMVREKIESSEVFLGIVNSKSYGTIAETGYASKCKNVAVYVLPEFGISYYELQDLWFVFQMAQTTEHLWCDEDIQIIEEFHSFNIRSVDEYKSYILSIVPNFMKS